MAYVHWLTEGRASCASAARAWLSDGPLQGKAGLARLKAVHGEAHLQHRQGVYHDFLDSARLESDAASSLAPRSVQEMFVQT